jgi:hypothetical protein
MKKGILLILLTCFAWGVYSQITINADDLMDAGDSVRLAAVDTLPPGFEPGPAGPDQLWDFSALTMDSVYQVNFLDPANTPYASSFPASNIAAEGLVEYGWAYATKNSFLFQIDGAAGSYDMFEDVVAPFNPPEVMFSFPANYLDSMEQTSTIDVTIDSPEPLIDSIRLKVVSEISSKIDAWGEIITPEWTGEVLRFRDERLAIDSAWIKTFGFWVYLESNSTFSVMYKYMGNDIGFPVLQFNVDESGTEYSLVSYMLDVGVGQQELPVEDNFSFDIYPNPASTILNCYLDNGTDGELVIYDLTGRQLRRQVFTGIQKQFSIDVSDFPAGMYHVIFRSDEQVHAVKKLLVH